MKTLEELRTLASPVEHGPAIVFAINEVAGRIHTAWANMPRTPPGEYVFHMVQDQGFGAMTREQQRVVHETIDYVLRQRELVVDQRGVSIHTLPGIMQGRTYRKRIPEVDDLAEKLDDDHARYSLYSPYSDMSLVISRIAVRGWDWIVRSDFLEGWMANICIPQPQLGALQDTRLHHASYSAHGPRWALELALESAVKSQKEITP